MKVMSVKKSDVDGCHDTLREELAKKFEMGGYTHIECNGSIHEVEVFTSNINSPIVMVGQEIISETVTGMSVLDPRTNERIISDNPALIFGELIRSDKIITRYNMIDEKEFNKRITQMADYCDKEVIWPED